MDSVSILTTNPFLSKIGTIIQTYSKDSAIELELRLHKYGKHYSKDGDNGIDRKAFNNLKSKLEEHFGEPEEIHSKDLINSSTNERQTIRINKETGEEEIFTIEKHTKYNNSEARFRDDPQVSKEVAEKLYIDFGTKLSLSLETKEIKSKSIMKTPSLIRVKHRYSWILTKTDTRIDLTKVTQSKPLSSESPETRYEVEIESLASEFSQGTKLSNNNLTAFVQKIKNLEAYLKFCIKTLHNTEKLYSFSMQKEVANFFNNKLDYKKFKFLEKGIPEHKVNLPPPGIAAKDLAVQARGIMKSDLRYGGLIGGKYQYTVTPKADGDRKFLIIHENGVWLISVGGKAEFNLIYPARTTELDYNHWIPYKNTIIDGEEIPMDNEYGKPRKGNYPDILHYYFPFDVLVIKGEDIRNKNLIERQTYIKIFTKITREPEDKLLLIDEKPFYLLSNDPEETYNIISKTINDTNIGFETDGLIFTPNSIYQPIEKNKDKSKNVPLSKQRSICKWKPLEKTSMDLKYKVTSKGRNFFYSNGDIDVLFEGTDRNSFNPEKQIDWYHPIFESLANGEIVELALKHYDENGDAILKPLKIRYDKDYANGKDVAESVWNDINDPIMEETITGKDIILMRKAHNSYKRSVLGNELIKMNSHLIDIGSGRGGDLDKLYKFSKVLFVEPDSDNLKELKQRMSQNILPEVSKKVLQAGGEDSQKILVTAKEHFGNDFGKKPLYISMMLSLSFFWKSKNFLQQLCNTINLLKEAYFAAGGKEMNFLYMTIEGERTYDLLTKNNNFIKLNDVSLSYYPEKELVHLSFPGKTIVNEQDEYLVNLYELFNLTTMEPIYEKVADDEKFLSKAEKILSSLYVYGQAKINNSPFVLYEREPEIPMPKVPENKSISNFIETISDKSPKMYSVKDKQKIPEIKEIINLESPKVSAEEKIFIPQKSNSTLFECIIKYFNKDSDEIPYNEVVKYRNAIALSVKQVNPFDVKGRTIYESAGKGIIKRLSKNEEDAVEWISSDNELKPKYIAWLPDVIGANLQVNDVLYPTKIQNEDVETIHLLYENKSYKLKL